MANNASMLVPVKSYMTMATSLSEFKDVSDIDKEIVRSNSENDSSDNEIGSLFSDSNTGENEVNTNGNKTTSELSTTSTIRPESTTIPSLLEPAIHLLPQNQKLCSHNSD